MTPADFGFDQLRSLIAAFSWRTTSARDPLVQCPSVSAQLGRAPLRTGFGKNDNGIWKLLMTLGAPFFRSPQSGARSLVWLALSDNAGALTGEYVQDEKALAPSAQAQDDTLAELLWERSAELVGLPADAVA